MSLRDLFNSFLPSIFSSGISWEFFCVARVDGVSMQPTLNPDAKKCDYVYLDRQAVRTKQIQRGEIVVLKCPKGKSLIKRVVGVAGDIVLTHGYKNGATIQVPENHYWVEGDHIGRSHDSNSFGPVALSSITAKVVCIVWPPSRWQYFYPSMLHHNFPLNTVKPSAGQTNGGC